MVREVVAVVVETTRFLTMVVAQTLLNWVVVAIMGVKKTLYVYESHTDSRISNNIKDTAMDVHVWKKEHI